MVHVASYLEKQNSQESAIHVSENKYYWFQQALM